MDRLQAMKIFVTAADVGGFAGAARQLHMSPPAVTRAIAMLEDHVGARLFVRTTRMIKLTEAGQRYLADCRRILAEIADAEAAAAGRYATPSGSLVVTASMLFGEMYVLPILLDYLDFYPAVIGHALFVDRVTNIVEEGIDVAVRIGNLPDSSLSAIRVGSVRRVICGTPAYFDSHGRPTQPGDLASHRIVAATASASALEWRFGGPGGRSVKVEPRLRCQTNEGAIAAVQAGWGLSRLLSYQIAPALAAGTLQTVLAADEEPPLPIHIVHHQGRRASATVRSFVDLAVDRLRANPLIN
ncbi:MAG: LysR family transcriptional regulator [Sphingomonas sp. 28-62-20]|uniref:LysR family transcriptional regulator n=1 Tax=Sphingomonas sp. 28-62-20 TaxID=1970433 RepID=UPI000BC8D64D|nr:MAG: LysR family transcriptional regulator [Sphingomonas sp. 28-62-20]